MNDQTRRGQYRGELRQKVNQELEKLRKEPDERFEKYLTPDAERFVKSLLEALVHDPSPEWKDYTKEALYTFALQLIENLNPLVRLIWNESKRKSNSPKLTTFEVFHFIEKLFNRADSDLKHKAMNLGIALWMPTGEGGRKP